MCTLLLVGGIVAICALQSLATWHGNRRRREPTAYDVLLHVKGTDPRTGAPLKGAPDNVWADFAMTEASGGIGGVGIGGGGIGGGC